MMKEDVIVRLDKPGLHPDGVSAFVLAQLLQDWEKAAAAEAAFDGANDSTAPLVSLVWVKDECAAYGLKFGPNGDAPNRRMLAGLAARGDKWAEVAPVAQESMIRLIRRFTSQHISVTMSFSEHDVPDITFTKDAPPPMVDRRRFAESLTTRSVRVVKAGGVRPAATVELVGGQYRVPVQGNKRIIQSLGSNLYQRVLLKGRAQWRLKDWKMVMFKAEEVMPYPVAPVNEVLTELAVASTGVWKDGIPGFLAEMRCEDDE